VEYIDVEGASCSCNRRITNIIEDILEFLVLVGASCQGNRELYILLKLLQNLLM